MVDSRYLMAGGVFSGPEIRADDSIRAGTLLAVDFGHPVFGLPTGVPANGATVPNGAAVEAAALMSTSQSSTLATIRNAGLTGSLGRVERTPRGGVHVILSTSQTASTAGFTIDLPTAIIAWMQANPTHTYGLSTWTRKTRAGTAGASASAIAQISSPTQHVLTQTTTSNIGLTGSANVATTVDAVGTNFRFQAGTPVGQPFVSAAISSIDRMVLTVGNHGLLNGQPARAGKQGASVLYRAILEDLTASARPAAEFLAAEQAAFSSAFALGGRYYGDTLPSDPTTLP